MPKNIIEMNPLSAGCADCMYVDRYVGTCDYFDMTGIRRGCEGGAKCKRKRVGTRRNAWAVKFAPKDEFQAAMQRYAEDRAQKTGIHLTEREHEIRLKLYNRRFTDKQIAAVRGISTTAVRLWRVRNGLEANGKKYTEGCK